VTIGREGKGKSKVNIYNGKRGTSIKKSNRKEKHPTTQTHDTRKQEKNTKHNSRGKKSKILIKLNYSGRLDPGKKRRGLEGGRMVRDLRIRSGGKEGAAAEFWN